MKKVREPSRIPIILEKLRIYWEANPDLRLGQIISNAASMKGVDPFYIEDSVTLAAIEFNIESSPKK